MLSLRLLSEILPYPPNVIEPMRYRFWVNDAFNLGLITRREGDWAMRQEIRVTYNGYSQSHTVTFGDLVIHICDSDMEAR